MTDRRAERRRAGASACRAWTSPRDKPKRPMPPTWSMSRRENMGCRGLSTACFMVPPSIRSMASTSIPEIQLIAKGFLFSLDRQHLLDPDFGLRQIAEDPGSPAGWFRQDLPHAGHAED